jgi:hypothetical protein
MALKNNNNKQRRVILLSEVKTQGTVELVKVISEYVHKQRFVLIYYDLESGKKLSLVADYIMTKPFNLQYFPYKILD